MNKMKFLTRLVVAASIMSVPVFTSKVNANLPPNPPPPDKQKNPKWVWTITGKDKCGCDVWGWVNECIDLKIKFGQAVSEPLMPQSYFMLRAYKPSNTIFSPQGLYFSSMFSSYMFPPTTVSAGKQIQIAKSDGTCIKFQINTGSSAGVPCGEYAGTPTRIKMLDANGNAVTSSPTYYEISFGDGVTSRYLASTGSVYSVTTAEGVNLVASDKSIGHEIINDTSGNLRQVWSAADGLADIVVIDNYKYEIRLYDFNNFGAKTNGLYAISGTPYTVWTIENPQHSSTQIDQVKFTKTVNGVSTEANWQYNTSADQWTLNNAGLQISSKSNIWDTGHQNLLINEEIKETDGSVKSKKTQNFHAFPFGTVPSTESTYVNASETLDTTYSYYGDVSSTDAKYGQQKQIINPDGSWVKYDYDSIGRKSSETVSWKNIAAGSSGGKVVVYSYAAVDSGDTPLENDFRPRKIETTIEGTLVKKEFFAYKVVNGENVKIEETAVLPSANYGAAGNSRKTTVYYGVSAGSPSAGREKTITYPDGKMDSFSYEYGNFSAGSTPSNAAFAADANGSSLRITKTTGTVDNPNGISNKSIQEKAVIDPQGNKVLAEKYVYTGSTYVRIGWKYKIYDSEHHVLHAYNSNNTIEDATWNCCNIASATKADGTEYTYSYDLLKRLISKTKKGYNGTLDIVTSYTYDAAGHQISESISDGTNTLGFSKTYDWAGRVTSETNASGLTTTYSYTKATSTTGEIITKTLPGGATEVTERYLDGNTKSITGTAVVAKYYDYGVDSFANQWVKESIGLETSPQWVKTYINTLGDVAKIERSGYNGTVIIQNYYNDKRQLIKATTTGKAPTLYVYDDLGNQTRNGLDINHNDILDLASDDRINETETVYSQIDSDWWQIITNRTYATVSSNTATTVSIKKNRLTGLASGTVAEEKDIDINGNETLANATISRSSKTFTRTVNVPGSSVDEQTIIVNGLTTTKRSFTNLTTTYTYDGLGRQTGIVDPRTGQTITAYYVSGTGKTGKVYTVTDAANNVTTYDYDANGQMVSVKNALNKYTYYSYNARGVVTKTWGDADYPTEKVYDNTGRITQLKTYRGGTGWISATWPTTTGDADTTAWTYDAGSGLVTAKTDAGNKSVNYTYTTDGKLLTRTWSRQVNNQALVTTYDYDSNTGEMTSIVYSDDTPDIEYTYNRFGKQAEVSDAVGIRTFSYNTALQLATEDISGTGNLYTKTLSRNYTTTDMVGRYTGMSIGSEYVVNYGYDGYRRLNSVASGNDTFSYAYLANSNLVQTITRPGNLSTTFSYEDHRNLITAIENKYNTTTVSAYGYVNDAVGRRISMARIGTAFSTADTLTFGYNDRSEVTSAVSNNVSTYNYGLSFDNIGNRLASSTAESGTPVSTSYTSNNVNQYTAVDAISPTYNDDGCITNDGTWTFSWNAENQLVKAEKSDTKLEFTYDYQSRRVEKKVYSGSGGTGWTLNSHLRFVYDNSKCIEVLDALNENTVRQKFIWQPEALRMEVPLCVYDESANYYYFTDANKNIGQLIDGSGSTVAQYEYSPFGKQTVSSGSYAAANPFCFSSEYLDTETRLVYYNYRYYSALLGRWLSRDPIEEKGGVNLYAMVNNNIVNKIDINGTHCNDCAKIYENCMNNADTELTLCRQRVQNEARDLYNSLWDSAKKTYNATMAVIEKTFQGVLANCEKIDRSTLWGTALYGACVGTAYGDYYIISGNAMLAFGAATAAIAGEIAAYETGHFLSCSLTYGIDTAACNTANTTCNQGYGKDSNGCPCKR